MAVRAKSPTRKRATAKSAVDAHLKQAAKHLAEAKKIDFDLDAQFKEVYDAVDELKNVGRRRGSSR